MDGWKIVTFILIPLILFVSTLTFFFISTCAFDTIPQTDMPNWLAENYKWNEIELIEESITED